MRSRARSPPGRGPATGCSAQFRSISLRAPPTWRRCFSSLFNEDTVRSGGRMNLVQVPLPADISAATPGEWEERIVKAKKALGRRLVVLGHHYQRDEVIRHADVTGDSFKLAQHAAARPEAEYIVFCGVHFMAESADILSAPHQKVILPDLHAGCSMADMADIDQVEEAWANLQEACAGQKSIPITYMTSAD